MSFSSDSSDNEDTEIVSEKIREIAKNVSFNLLPQKSRQKYTATYNSFKKWRKDNGSNSFCKDVMLAYFDEMSKTYAPSSLWAIYSMLRSTINTFDQIDIGSYKKLTYLLKRKSKGFQSKKSKVFTKEDISKFLNDAPNEIFLCMKVVLIFGIAGALRKQEFVNLKVNDVIESENSLIVKILITKNKMPRSFIINDKLYEICKEYMKNRPQPCSSDRFFLKYSNGKCTQQPIGINTFGSMPKEVATYLNLIDAELYTGHSFRRTSATLLVDAGADVTILKRHGGWQSNSVAEGYIAQSLHNKRKISEQITSGIVLNKKSKTGNITDSSKLANDVLDYSVNALSQPKTIDQNSLANRNVCSASSRIQSPDIMIRENSMIETTSNNVQEKLLKFKSPVFYDPGLGLYILESSDKCVNELLVCDNCNGKMVK